MPLLPPLRPGSQRSTLRARSGSHGEGWPCPSWSPKAGRVWCGAAWCAPPVPAMYSRRSSPGANLAIGMWVLLPKETVAFLAFLSLARAQREPLGAMLRDCLSFRPSTLPMPFLVSLQNCRLLEGPERRWDPGAALARRWPGTGRALHSGPLPRREVPVPWMEQSMPRHERGQHVGRQAEADPASKAGVTRESQPWCVTAG